MVISQGESALLHAEMDAARIGLHICLASKQLAKNGDTDSCLTEERLLFRSLLIEEGAFSLHVDISCSHKSNERISFSFTGSFTVVAYAPRDSIHVVWI